jgi:hypothetical protein
LSSQFLDVHKGAELDMTDSQQPTPGSQSALNADTEIDDKHTYVDQVRVRYGFGVILCAFLLVAFTVCLSVYFFFSANEAVAVIGTVTGMIASIVSTWFGISSANAVANRALSGQSQTSSRTGAPAPTVSAVSPAAGPAGTEVALTGSAFTGVTGVTFGGIPSADVKVVSDSTITADAPEGKNPSSTAGVDVIVVGASGVLSSPSPNVKFTFKGVGVGRLVPSHGKSKQMISVLGNGFKAGVSYNVNFGNVPAAAADVTFVDETTLHVLVPVPAAAAGSAQAVIVTVAETNTPAAPVSGTHAQAVFIYDV